jgi:hypothetical protein
VQRRRCLVKESRFGCEVSAGDQSRDVPGIVTSPCGNTVKPSIAASAVAPLQNHSAQVIHFGCQLDTHSTYKNHSSKAELSIHQRSFNSIRRPPGDMLEQKQDDGETVINEMLPDTMYALTV